MARSGLNVFASSRASRGNRVAATVRRPEDDELAHPDGETRQIGDHAAVGHQDQRQPTAMVGDPSLIGPDALHPTQQGLEVMAQTFSSAIEQALELPPQ